MRNSAAVGRERRMSRGILGEVDMVAAADDNIVVLSPICRF